MRAKLYHIKNNSVEIHQPEFAAWFDQNFGLTPNIRNDPEGNEITFYLDSQAMDGGYQLSTLIQLKRRLKLFKAIKSIDVRLGGSEYVTIVFKHDIEYFYK